MTSIEEMLSRSEHKKKEENGSVTQRPTMETPINSRASPTGIVSTVNLTDLETTQETNLSRHT